MRYFSTDNLETVVQDTLKNQLGEEIVTDAITYVGYDQNMFVVESLNCLGASSINNGTCRCVNHETYSREELDWWETLECYGLETIQELINIHPEQVIVKAIEDILGVDSLENLLWCQTDWHTKSLFHEGDRIEMTLHHHQESPEEIEFELEIVFFDDSTLGWSIEIEGNVARKIYEDNSFFDYLKVVEEDEGEIVYAGDCPVCKLDNFIQWQK